MTHYQVNEILEGTALLEYVGNLYEYIGMNKNKYVFQSLNDDSYVEAKLEYLLTMPEYDIQY